MHSREHHGQQPGEDRASDRWYRKKEYLSGVLCVSCDCRHIGSCVGCTQKEKQHDVTDEPVLPETAGAPIKNHKEGTMVERLTAYFRKWENMEAERKQEKGTEDGSKETEPVSGRL